MRIVAFVVLFLVITPTLFAQETRISGRVSDINRGAIANVKVIAVGTNASETFTTTDENGLYDIRMSNVVLLKFNESRGFRNVEVRYCSTSKKELKFDLVLDVDLESSGMMYSEFVCDKDGNNCKYLSRLGTGPTKPKKVTLNCSRTKHNLLNKK